MAVTEAVTVDAEDGSIGHTRHQGRSGDRRRREDATEVIAETHEQLLVIRDGEEALCFLDKLIGGPAPSRRAVRFLVGECRENAFA